MYLVISVLVATWYLCIFTSLW